MATEEDKMFSKRPKIPVLADLSRGAVEKFMYAYKLYRKRDDRMIHFLDIYIHQWLTKEKEKTQKIIINE